MIDSLVFNRGSFSVFLVSLLVSHMSRGFSDTRLLCCTAFYVFIFYLTSTLSDPWITHIQLVWFAAYISLQKHLVVVTIEIHFVTKLFTSSLCLCLCRMSAGFNRWINPLFLLSDPLLCFVYVFGWHEIIWDQRHAHLLLLLRLNPPIFCAVFLLRCPLLTFNRAQRRVRLLTLPLSGLKIRVLQTDTGTD